MTRHDMCDDHDILAVVANEVVKGWTRGGPRKCLCEESTACNHVV